MIVWIGCVGSRENAEMCWVKGVEVQGLDPLVYNDGNDGNETDHHFKELQNTLQKKQWWSHVGQVLGPCLIALKRFYQGSLSHLVEELLKNNV